MATDPKTVALNLTDMDPQRIRNRLRVLKEKGLLKRPDQIHEKLDEKGSYEVTEFGHTVADEDSVSKLRELFREHENNN